MAVITFNKLASNKIRNHKNEKVLFKFVENEVRMRISDKNEAGKDEVLSDVSESTKGYTAKIPNDYLETFPKRFALVDMGHSWFRLRDATDDVQTVGQVMPAGGSIK